MPSAWGAEGIKQSIDQVQYFTGSPREQTHVNNNHHHQGHATRSYCPVDSVSNVVYTLIHAQAEETEISEDALLNNTARRTTMASTMSLKVSKYTRHWATFLQVLLIPSARRACNLSDYHHSFKKEVCRGGSNCPRSPHKGGGRTHAGPLSAKA